MRILVLNGPNLNRLGTREPSIYGADTQESILERLRAAGPGHKFELAQSNHEGELIDRLHRAADEGTPVLLNPGGFTHTSVALRDAVAIVVEAGVPVVELHLSNPHAREPFRHRSLVAGVASGTIAGFGAGSYLAGLAAIEHLEAKRASGQ
ncbi:3-dehydroquinate dehydratase [Pseudoclavibacter triregionum]|nr:3-dehydroquinate dehydratase [Pseudoclavibacter triregionum]